MCVCVFVCVYLRVCECVCVCVKAPHLSMPLSCVSACCSISQDVACATTSRSLCTLVGTLLARKNVSLSDLFLWASKKKNLLHCFVIFIVVRKLIHYCLSLLISSSVPNWPCKLVKEIMMIKWTGSNMCERRSHGEQGLSRLFRFILYSWCESAQEFVCKQICVNSSTRIYLFISGI